MSTLGNGAVVGPANEVVTAVTANYTVTSSDQYVQVTTGASPANIVVTLPAPAPLGSYVANSDPASSTLGSLGNVGQRVFVQKVDSANGKATITGKLNVGASTTLVNKNQGITVISDGTVWNVVGSVS